MKAAKILFKNTNPPLSKIPGQIFAESGDSEEGKKNTSVAGTTSGQGSNFLLQEPTFFSSEIINTESQGNLNGNFSLSSSVNTSATQLFSQNALYSINQSGYSINQTPP